MKKTRLMALLICLCLLTGCTTAPAPEADPGEPLPIAAPNASAAPIGDTGLSYEAIATLCLPARDGQQLLTIYEPLTFSYSIHPAETVVRALLAHGGNDRVSPVSSAALVVAGGDPVEVSCSIATVNLSAAALGISREELHTVCRAITATLCQMDDIDHVNILVSGVPVAVDHAGYLPLGTLTAQTGQELPVLWEQLLARRVPEGTLATAAPLTATAALYFPLTDGSGIAPEVRRITFSGQHPQQLVMALLTALSAGSETLPSAADYPDLNALMTAVPEIAETADGHLRVTLSFTGDLRSWITAAGADPACTFAALVNTLTTFVPNLTEVCIYTGERAVTSVMCDAHGSQLFEGGVHTRVDYSGYLMSLTQVYSPSESWLSAQSAALPYRSVHSPRALLLAMNCLPGPLSDADVLGLSVSGDTLTVNLSARYADVLRDCPEDQRLLAYAMVNTLCKGLDVRRVRFCFDSTQIDNLGGELLWSGDFLYNPGLIR